MTSITYNLTSGHLSGDDTLKLIDTLNKAQEKGGKVYCA